MSPYQIHIGRVVCLEQEGSVLELMNGMRLSSLRNWNVTEAWKNSLVVYTTHIIITVQTDKLTLNNNIDCLPLATQVGDKHPDTAGHQHHRLQI